MLKNTMLILFLISTFIIANGKPTIIDKEILEASLNYDFNKADKILNEHYANSKDLKYHFLYLNIELQKSIKAAEKIPIKLKQSVKDSLNQILIDYTEKIIQQYENKNLTIDEKFYLGSMYGLLGRFYGVQRSWMNAFSNGKEGRDILEEVIEENPEYTDAYLLLGMLNYYTDRLGGITEFIAGVLGLSGDRITGLNYLKKVAKSGTLNTWNASMILSEIYARMERDQVSALPLLKKFYNNFPRNSHFANWYCYELVELDYLNEATKMLSTEGSEFVADYVKAAYFHKVANYQKSNQFYELMFKHSETIFPWLIEIGKFRQLINYVMLNNIDKAKSLLPNLSDAYKKQSEVYINNSKMMKALFEFRTNLFLNGSSALSSKPDKQIFNHSNYGNAFYNYTMGIYFFNNQKYELADDFFTLSKKADFKSFGFNASNYQLLIYNRIMVDKNKVEILISDIDELDNDSLEYRAEDLEVKYSL